MSDFELFREEVLSYYERQKVNNLLPVMLAAPSPANLKELALLKFRQGLTPADEKVYRDYYCPLEFESDLGKAIRTKDVDKHKSIQNFILRKTKAPKEEIVKLVAVLIDFQPRPFVFNNWKSVQEHYNVNKEIYSASKPTTDYTTVNKINLPKERHSMEVSAADIKKAPPPHTPHTPHNAHAAHNMYIKPSALDRFIHKYRATLFLLAGIILLSLISSFYLLPVKQCMCWLDDHYIAVHCINTVNTVRVIALDQHKLATFKKINDLNALCKNGGKGVWYSKINDEVEFFTGPGYHPIADQIPLKVATNYIIQEYVGCSFPDYVARKE